MTRRKPVAILLCNALIAAAAPAHASGLFARCGTYAVHARFAAPATLTVSPGARSETTITLAAPAPKADDYDGLPVEARIEVTRGGQGFRVNAKLVAIDFVLPDRRRRDADITLLAPKSCTP